MPKAPPRRTERSLAFQVLYSQEFVSCGTLEELEKAFALAPRQDEQAGKPAGFAWDLVRGVWENEKKLDEIISAHSNNWRLERVGRVELTLLRLAVYEMLYCPDVPPKVAMNEALDLNRQFGEEKSKAFVNGILDAVSKADENGPLSQKDR